MKNLIKTMNFITFIISFTFIIYSCSGDNFIKRKKEGNSIVEAKFINDSLIDGVAKFYDINGTLLAKGTYIEGIRNGPSLIYYTNGQIKDSLNYRDDLLIGQSSKFDSNGEKLFTLTHYYGVELGDHFYFNGGKIKKYYFTDFEKNLLVESKYDSTGFCDFLYFNAAPTISNYKANTDSSVKRIFLYFPHPPNFEVKYILGKMINDKKEEFILNTNRLFLDSIIKSQQKNEQHYISIVYRNVQTDSTFNIFYKKLDF